MRIDELRSRHLFGGLDSSIEQRLAFVAGFMLVVFLIFVVRLFQLQVVEGEQHDKASTKNSVRSVRLLAPRGDILDRNGHTLATTRPAFGVQVIPSDLRRRERTVDALAMLLDGDAASLDQQIGESRGRRRFQAVRLAGDLSYDQMARVESHLYVLPGVVTDIRPRRFYVEGDRAAHVLGYIGQIQAGQLEQRRYQGYRPGEVIGQAGIETLLEADLRGQQGGRNLVVDVAGRVVEVLDEQTPVSGGTVTLSIDKKLQRVAEQAFLPEVLGAPARLGAVVAMDVHNGDVLALVSKPSYDPNSFAGGIDAETWEQLAGDEWRPIQDRAISGQYPPGSVFKLIVAAAGLEEGVIDPEETVYCPGHFRLGRRTYRCWKRAGHGPVNFRDAIKASCDVYFYQLGLKLGIGLIGDYARAFSFGRRTGISLVQEGAGLVPTSEWKERRFGEPWMKGETVSAAIGQGFNLATPLQVAVAFAALANGGTLLRPRLVLQVRKPDGTLVPGPPVRQLGRVPVAPEHFALLRDALEAVVEEEGGTARLARVPGIRVAGKTGTAQVVRLKYTDDLEEDEIPIRFRDHAWFAAFAPADDPEIVVVALIEHGGHGGSAAAPVVQRVLDAYFEDRLTSSAEAAMPPAAAMAAAEASEVDVVRD